MFGSMVLEVAIGVVFVYLLLSLIVTAVTELIAGWLKWRSQNLWEGVRNLVDSGEAAEWATKLYDHPLIQGISPAQKQPVAAKTAKTAKATGPSYIPSRTFAVTLLEVLKDSNSAGQAAITALRQAVDTTPDSAPLGALKAALTDAVKSLPNGGAAGVLKGEAAALAGRIPDTVPLGDAKKDVQSWLTRLPDRWLHLVIEDMPDSKLKKSLAALVEESHGDLEHLKTNIEVWFNNSMERVSGWYKRKTQAVHVVLAVAVTLVINVDSVLVVNALSQNQALRDSVVAESEALAKAQPAPGASGAAQPAVDPIHRIEGLQSQLNRLDLPVGWVLPGQRAFSQDNSDFRVWPGWHWQGRFADWLMFWAQTVRFHLLGWLLTAMAISLGAPFWFDMLNKVINIRSSGKAPEEKPKSPQTVPQPLEPGQAAPAA